MDNKVETLHQGYLAALEGWQEQPNKIQTHYRELTAKSWSGAKYLVRNLPNKPEQLVMCPPGSMLNMAPNQQHRGDYGTGVFEGSSAEPVIDSNNKVVGINVILHQPRMARFLRSMQARNYNLQLPLEDFAQSVLDLVAIHGIDIVTADDGSPTRAYIRPSAGPGVGPWGVSLRPNYFIEASNLVFRWGSYFPNVNRISTEGAHVMTCGAQRTFKITGKHASNYGAAAVDGFLARTLNYDELAYLAPYCIKNNELDYGIREFDQLIKYGVLADGPGEEVFALLKDNATLIYPPMRVNRLGGTMLDYVMKYLAPAMGFTVREQDITLEQIRRGEIIALAYAGNAVKVTPIGKLDVVKSKDLTSGDRIETVLHTGIHPSIAKIRDQLLTELSGKKQPSHESLLTPVDLEWGKEFRSHLDDCWRKLGF